MDYNITAREKEVMELLIQGKGNNEISKTLVITPHTTKAHLESIYKKFGVKNRVAAVIKYLECTERLKK